MKFHAINDPLTLYKKCSRLQTSLLTTMYKARSMEFVSADD